MPGKKNWRKSKSRRVIRGIVKKFVDNLNNLQTI